MSLGGAIGSACAFVCMRYMKGIHYTICPFWFATGSVIGSPIAIATQRSLSEDYREKVSTVFDTKLIIMVLLVAIFATCGQNLTSRAYQLEKTSRVSATNYLCIVIAFIWDILIYKEPLKQTDIIGSVLIVGTFAICTLIKTY